MHVAIPDHSLAMHMVMPLSQHGEAGSLSTEPEISLDTLPAVAQKKKKM